MSDVVHAAERSRFEAVEGEHIAVLTYVLSGDHVVLEHTVVPPEMGGRGIGSDLARAALGWAREQGLAVVPQCSFVQSFLAKRPEAAEGTTLRRATGV